MRSQENSTVIKTSSWNVQLLKHCIWFGSVRFSFSISIYWDVINQHQFCKRSQFFIPCDFTLWKCENSIQRTHTHTIFMLYNMLASVGCYFLFVLALVQSRKKDFQSDLSTSMAVNRSHNSPGEKTPIVWLSLPFDIKLWSRNKKIFSVCAFFSHFIFSMKYSFVVVVAVVFFEFRECFEQKQKSAKHLYSVIACSHHHANALECVLI